MTIRKQTRVTDIEAKYGRLTFGRLLKSHREGEEISQVLLARMLGISKQSLNDLENGRKIPSIRRALEIGRKLDFVDDVVVQIVLQEQVDKEHISVVVKIESAGGKRAS